MASPSTPPRPRSRTPSADIRSALLVAATQLLRREGPDALAVRRIAAEANVAPMAVYNHFDGKHGIIEALWVAGFERLRSTLDDLRQIEDPLLAMAEGLRAYRRLALDDPMTYRLMFQNAIPGFVPSAEAAWTAALAFQALVASVARAREAGALPIEDDIQVAQVMWAAIHGWVALELDGLIFLGDPEAGATAMISSFIEGFRNHRP